MSHNMPSKTSQSRLSSSTHSRRTRHSCESSSFDRNQMKDKSRKEPSFESRKSAGQRSSISSDSVDETIMPTIVPELRSSIKNVDKGLKAQNPPIENGLLSSSIHKGKVIMEKLSLRGWSSDRNLNFDELESSEEEEKYLVAGKHQMENKSRKESSSDESKNSSQLHSLNVTSESVQETSIQTPSRQMENGVLSSSMHKAKRIIEKFSTAGGKSLNRLPGLRGWSSDKNLNFDESEISEEEETKDFTGTTRKTGNTHLDTKTIQTAENDCLSESLDDSSERSLDISELLPSDDLVSSKGSSSTLVSKGTQNDNSAKCGTLDSSSGRNGKSRYDRSTNGDGSSSERQLNPHYGESYEDNLSANESSKPRRREFKRTRKTGSMRSMRRISSKDSSVHSKNETMRQSNHSSRSQPRQRDTDRTRNGRSVEATSKNTSNSQKRNSIDRIRPSRPKNDSEMLGDGGRKPSKSDDRNVTNNEMSRSMWTSQQFINFEVDDSDDELLNALRPLQKNIGAGLAKNDESAPDPVNVDDTNSEVCNDDSEQVNSSYPEIIHVHEDGYDGKLDDSTDHNSQKSFGSETSAPIQSKAKNTEVKEPIQRPSNKKNISLQRLPKSSSMNCLTEYKKNCGTDHSKGFYDEVRPKRLQRKCSLSNSMHSNTTNANPYLLKFDNQTKIVKGITNSSYPQGVHASESSNDGKPNDGTGHNSFKSLTSEDSDRRRRKGVNGEVNEPRLRISSKEHALMRRRGLRKSSSMTCLIETKTHFNTHSNRRKAFNEKSLSKRSLGGNSLSNSRHTNVTNTSRRNSKSHDRSTQNNLTDDSDSNGKSDYGDESTRTDDEDWQIEGENLDASAAHNSNKSLISEDSEPGKGKGKSCEVNESRQRISNKEQDLLRRRGHCKSSSMNSGFEATLTERSSCSNRRKIGHEKSLSRRPLRSNSVRTSSTRGSDHNRRTQKQMTDDSDSNISSDGDDASMKADDEDPPLHLGNPMEDEGLCSPSNKKAILQKSISTLITGMVTTSVFQRFQKNAVVDVDAHQNEKIIAIVDSRTRTNELVDKILNKKNCATNIRGDNTMDESKSDIDGKKRQNLLEVSRTRLSERNF